MKSLRIARRAVNVVFLVGGLSLSAYGVIELFSLDHIAIGRFDPDGRDTGSVAIFIALGICSAIYGLVSLTLGD